MVMLIVDSDTETAHVAEWQSLLKSEDQIGLHVSLLLRSLNCLVSNSCCVALAGHVTWKHVILLIDTLTRDNMDLSG